MNNLYDEKDLTLSNHISMFIHSKILLVKGDPPTYLNTLFGRQNENSALQSTKIMSDSVISVVPRQNTSI